MKRQPIAVIGGMGPEASVYFYNTLIKQSVKYFGAVNNDDFPEIVLYSVPVPDFISTNERRDEALEILKEKVKSLNQLNPQSIAIACNTAHILLKDLQEVSSAPFVSMIDEVVTEVAKGGINTVGIIGTPSTIRSGMYQEGLKKIGIESIIPNSDEIIQLDEIIRNVIAEKASDNDTQTLKIIADRMKSLGAQGIVLGCTEIPLVFPKEYDLMVLNSVEILSKKLLEEYYSQN